MNVPSLRGLAAKKKFVKTHNVRCLWHSTLPPGEKLCCCCGTPLQEEYFEFSYDGEKGAGILYAGPNCGDALMRESLLIGKPIADPGYFDPYGLNTQAGRPHAGGAAGPPGYVRADPENREMVQAISLLLHCWTKKEGPLLNERNALRDNPQRKPQDWALRMLNKAIRNTCRHYAGVLTLRELFDYKCQEKSVQGKSFRFSLLEKRLRDLYEDPAL